jgi:hypothetical protein
MKNQIISEEFHRMQKLAGLLNEAGSPEEMVAHLKQALKGVFFTDDWLGNIDFKILGIEKPNEEIFLRWIQEYWGLNKKKIDFDDFAKQATDDEIKSILNFILKKSNFKPTNDASSSQVISQLQNIQKTRTPQEIDDEKTGETLKVDIIDANNVLYVYNNLLTPENQKKFLTLGLKRMISKAIDIKGSMSFD